MTEYRAYVFDMDGVLLDSNGVKAQAFYEVALPYGEDAAHQLVEYHAAAGGVGRRARFEHLFAHILCREPEPGELEGLMQAAGMLIRRRTLDAPLVEGVIGYLSALPHGADRLVVSGVDSGELTLLLGQRHLLQWFDRVWGSPPAKAELLHALVGSGDVALPAVYYGDTEDDYHAARGAGLDFVFVSGCSDWDPPADHLARRQELRDFTAVAA